MVYVDKDEENKKKKLAAVERYRKRHPDRAKEAIKKYAKKNRCRINKNHAEWVARNMTNPEYRKNINEVAMKNHWMRQSKKILEVIGRPKPAVCEVCGLGGKICFDHCHDSKEFRGWLCDRCNLSIGHAKDDPKLLRKLADYLEKDRRNKIFIKSYDYGRIR